MTHTIKEIIWFHCLLGEIFWPLKHLITLYLDNQSPIALAHMQGQFHTRTKHIDIRYHFIRYMIDSGEIQIISCPTEDMTPDILMEALPRGKAKTLCMCPWALFVLQGSVRIQNVCVLPIFRLFPNVTYPNIMFAYYYCVLYCAYSMDADFLSHVPISWLQTVVSLVLKYRSSIYLNFGWLKSSA